MKEEQKQCNSQPAQFRKISPYTSRGTFSMEEKVLTAEQYRDWQFIGATLSDKISRYAE